MHGAIVLVRIHFGHVAEEYRAHGKFAADDLVAGSCGIAAINADVGIPVELAPGILRMDVHNVVYGNISTSV